jgi:hypothetical protein
MKPLLGELAHQSANSIIQDISQRTIFSLRHRGLELVALVCPLQANCLVTTHRAKSEIHLRRFTLWIAVQEK